MYIYIDRESDRQIERDRYMKPITKTNKHTHQIKIAKVASIPHLAKPKSQNDACPRMLYLACFVTVFLLSGPPPFWVPGKDPR